MLKQCAAVVIVTDTADGCLHIAQNIQPGDTEANLILIVLH